MGMTETKLFVGKNQIEEQPISNSNHVIDEAGNEECYEEMRINLKKRLKC